jgi:hypothetical protein
MWNVIRFDTERIRRHVSTDHMVEAIGDYIGDKYGAMVAEETTVEEIGIDPGGFALINSEKITLSFDGHKIILRQEHMSGILTMIESAKPFGENHLKLYGWLHVYVLPRSWVSVIQKVAEINLRDSLRIVDDKMDEVSKNPSIFIPGRSL